MRNWMAFKPALLGRMVTVPYYPISDDILRLIVKLQLKKIENRIRDNHNAQFSYDDAVIETVAKRCTDVDSGARNVYNILTGSLLPVWVAPLNTFRINDHGYAPS